MSSISTSYRELLQHRRDLAVCGHLLAAIGASNRANSIPRATLCMHGRPGEPDAIGLHSDRHLVTASGMGGIVGLRWPSRAFCGARVATLSQALCILEPWRGR